MSDLMPDVSLDEDDQPKPGIPEEQKKSTEEEQSKPTSEESSEVNTRESKSADSDTVEPSSSDSGLEVYPDQSPDLSEKLGLLVSEEVEELLDEAYLSMRMEHGKSAKKSLIVEAALRYLLSDYQKNEVTDSELSQWMQHVVK
jgi:hypothetical protein